MNIKLTLVKTGCRIALLSFLAAVIAMPTLADVDKKNKIEEARNTVEAFCKAEFDGNEFDQRTKLIKFSPAREKKEKERTGPASAWVVFWDWDPFYIVRSYKILNIELKDNHGIATVEYKRAAESKGKGKIISSPKASDIVKLDILYDQKQWWVFDPPLPRISLNALTKMYETNKYFTQKEEVLKVLQSISN